MLLNRSDTTSMNINGKITFIDTVSIAFQIHQTIRLKQNLILLNIKRKNQLNKPRIIAILYSTSIVQYYILD